MEKLQEKVNEIEEIKLLKDNQDGTKQYAITSSQDVDLRKKLFDILPKEEITIFELKKSESTLEEAFIKLIELDQKQSAEKQEEPKKQEKKKKAEKQPKPKKEEKKEQKLPKESKINKKQKGGEK